MQIIPIKDLKDTAKISEMCHASKDPIFVTKNGYSDLVIMSSEAYEAIEFERQMDEAIRQAENGEGIPFKTVMADLRKKYGTHK